MIGSKGKILVTGADGRLGNVILRTLLEHGWSVRAGLHPDSKFGASLEGVGGERCYLDLTKPETLPQALEGCEFVMHLASVISMKTQDTPLMERVNVEGTRNLLKAARAAGVKRFIYASSCDAFEVPQRGATVNEECRLALNDHNPYNRTKAQAMQLALGYNSEAMTVLAIAPGGISGPFDFEPSLQASEFVRGTVSNFAIVPAASFDYVDVRDLAVTFMNALTRGRGGEAYLVGGHSITQAEVVGILRQVTGRPPSKVRTLSTHAIRRALTVKAVADRLLRRPDDGLLMGLSVLENEPRFDTSKATRELGHQSRPIQETITDLALFLKEQGKL